MGDWTYQHVQSEEGVRRIVALKSVLPVAAGTTDLQPAQLSFTDDPVSGYDCSLTLGSGDFHCPIGCEIAWLIDDRDIAQVHASRANDNPPHLVLDEPRHRWFELREARLLTIQFRGKDYNFHKAMFDVSGLDRGRLDWDQQRYAELYWEDRDKALQSSDQS